MFLIIFLPKLWPIFFPKFKNTKRFKNIRSPGVIEKRVIFYISHFKRNKFGLFGGSFFWGGVSLTPPPLATLYFKKIYPMSV